MERFEWRSWMTPGWGLCLKMNFILSVKCI